MQSCDPVNDWSDPVPQVETRREKLARWLSEGRNQQALSAREYARRRYRAAFGRNPKSKEWPL